MLVGPCDPLIITRLYVVLTAGQTKVTVTPDVCDFGLLFLISLSVIVNDTCRTSDVGYMSAVCGLGCVMALGP